MKVYKIIALTAIIFSIFILTSCKKSDSTIIKETYNNMTKQHNYVLRNTIDLKIGSIEDNHTYIMNVDMNSNNEGLIKSEVTPNRYDFIAYIEVKDDNVYSYTKINNEWIKRKINTIVNSDQYILKVFDNYSKIEKIGTDELKDGTKVTIYNLTFTDKEILNRLSSYELNFDSIGITEDILNEAIKDTVVKLYIDTEKNIVRKMEIDLKKTLNKIADLNNSEHVDKCYVTYTFDYFGNTSVTLPNELKELPLSD